MSGVTVYVTDEEQPWSATVRASEPVLWPDGKVLAPSIVVAHMRIGDVSVVMKREQAEQLRDELSAALGVYDQTTAAAPV